MSGFQTVKRLTDPMEAELLVGLLGDNGIGARLIGTRHGPSIGVGQQILMLRIEVADGDADRALELIESTADAGDGGVRARPDKKTLSHLIGGGAAIVIPGGGHFYARQPIAASLIGIGEVLLLVSSSLGGIAGLILLIGYDLLDGQRVIASYNRGESESASGQARRTVVVWLVAVAVAWVVNRLQGS